MKDETDPPLSAVELRRLAEARALSDAAAASADLPAQSPEAMRRTLHELRVYQIELEMQNEELRRSQKALETAQARYFDLYDRAPVGYLTVSEKGLILEANLAATSLLGVPRSVLTMRPLSSLVLREDQDLYFLNRQRLFASGAPQALDLRLVKHGGTVFWAHLRSTIASAVDGSPVARVVLSDVSERKRHEATAAARLRLLSLAPTQTVDELLRACLAEAEALTGSRVGFCHFIAEDQNTVSLQTWSTNTVKKHSAAGDAGRYHPVDQAGLGVDCLRQRRALLHNDYAALAHCQGLPPGNAPLVRLLTVPVLRGGLVMALLGVGNKPTDYNEEDTQTVATLADLTWDIAEKKRAEMERQEGENRLRAITDSAQDAILMMDPEGRVSFWNPAAERLFGYSRAEALGQNLHTLIAHERHHAAHHAAFPKFQQTGQGGALGRTLAFEARHKDGREIAVELSLSAVQVGDAWQAVGVIRDVTERQRAAAALQAAHAELEQRVVERTRELSQANAATEVSRNFVRAILDALPDHLCVVDDAGVILSTNRAWDDFADGNPPAARHTAVGANYLDICDAAMGQAAAEAQAVAQGLRAVLHGEREQLALEYPCHSPSEQRWFLCRITRLAGAESRQAVITHTDITQRRLAQAELQANQLFLQETQRIARLAGWKANPRTDYLEWSDGIFDIIEAPKGRQPGLAEGFKFCLPEYVPPLLEALTRCLETGVPFALECRGTTGTGRKIWTHVRGIAPLSDGNRAYVMGTLQDITGRKLAEAQLRQLSAAVEQSSTSIVITTLSGDIEYVNPEFTKLTGYSLAEVLGKNPRILQSGQTNPATYPALWANLTAGLAWRGEFCNRKKNGELCWEAVAISPIRDATGQVTHYVGVKNDFTERQQLQAALRKSQEEFRAIADYTVDWETWFGTDGKILWVNLAVERITGYTPAEVLALPDFIATLVAPEDRDFFATAFQDALRGSCGNDLEFRCVHKNGSQFWLSMSWQTIFDAQGKPLGVRASGHDITQRKQAELALRESQELLSTFLRHSPIYTYIKTVTPTDSRVLMASDKFQQMLGCSGAELVGKTTTELFPPELAAKIIADDWGVVSRGKVLTTDETLTDRTYTTVKFPIVQGGETLLAGYSLDITEREQARAALQKSMTQLVATNDSLHAATLRANQMALKAEQANAAKSTFLASMSHELRSPMTAVLGFSELLDDNRMGTLNDRQLRYIKLIRENGQHLLTLINDLLDLARVESGNTELHWEPTSLATICAASLHVVTPLAEKKRLTLTQDLAHAPAQWPTDGQRLKQILINLLSNAVKFTPEGGKVGLELAVDTEPRQLRITVWDTGIGISPENQTHLFEPFFQIDSALSRQHAGTGLGLPLVDRFTRLMGGRVTLQSTAGQGCRFTVHLPWRDNLKPTAPPQTAAAVAEPSPPPAATTPAQPEAHLILLVDDDESLLELCSSSLTMTGEFRVLAASSGTEALGLLSQHQPAMIVTDIQMPGMDGLELVRRVRQFPAPLGTIPIVTVTALAMAGDRELCLAAGADEYLTKPVLLKDLRALIQRRLHRSAEAKP